MNELALFAGAGGGILGTHLLGWRPVCAVEIEPYAREVLLRRQEDKILPPFPIWDDVRTFDGKPWRGIVDIVTAGFPCQPFSIAGRMQSDKDERNMWPDTIRIISEVEPRICLLENVPALLAHQYFGTILGQISEMGYRCRWGIVSAADAGAPHLRKRLWIVAHADSDVRERGQESYIFSEAQRKAQHRRDAKRLGHDVSDTNGARLEGAKRSRLSRTVRQPQPARHDREEWWEAEPELGRVADGVAYRVDRLKSIGNGQVSPVVRLAWNELAKE